jgi:hypothetical protein
VAGAAVPAADAPVPAAAGASASSAEEPADAAAGELPVEIKGPTATLALAVAGVLKGAERYELASPPGVGVKLPHARPRIAPGAHHAAAPFGRLLVQRRGGGSLVRLYYDPKTWTADVRFERDTVRLALRRR